MFRSIAIVLVVTACARQPRPASVASPAAATFGEIVQIYGNELGLRSLPRLLPRGEVEIRLWEGFGITGVWLTRVVRQDATWHAATYYPAGLDSTQVVVLKADSVNWSERWERLQQSPFFSLPPSPRRQPTQYFTDDGYSQVLEVATDTGYWIVGADNPGSRFTGCSNDDRLFLQATMAFIQYPDWNPLAGCES